MYLPANQRTAGTSVDFVVGIDSRDPKRVRSISNVKNVSD